MTHVILTGFMASGKTAVGRCLASKLRRPFLDLDAYIEESQGRSIGTIFAEDGEEAFRAIERACVATLRPERASVIATGGGTFVDASNREVLRSLGVVVCLVVAFETVIERVGRKATRPLAQGPNPETRLRELWEQRMPAYRKADILVETDGLTIEESVARVAASLEPRLRKAGARDRRR